MGYIRHHSIAVSSWDEEKIIKMHEAALSIFGKEQTTEIIGPVLNSYRSFFIGPDGSKEGWEDSDLGDERRKTFLTILDSLKFDDGSNSVRYCEFIWGDDCDYAGIANHN